MKYFSTLIVLLFLMLPALAGDPGELYWSLDARRKVDAQINLEIEQSLDRLKKDQITIVEANKLWRALLVRADKNGEEVRALQNRKNGEPLSEGETIPELYQLLDLVRKQFARINLLVQGSDIEIEKGRAAAEETYGWQRESAAHYYQLKKSTDEQFARTLANP